MMFRGTHIAPAEPKLYPGEVLDPAVLNQNVHPLAQVHAPAREKTFPHCETCPVLLACVRSVTNYGPLLLDCERPRHQRQSARKRGAVQELILMVLDETPGLTGVALRGLCGGDASFFYRALRSLVEAGVIEPRRGPHSNAKYYYITEEA